MNRWIRVALTALIMGASANASAAVWYVFSKATGVEDGTSWDDAFKTIQPAIDAAFADGGGEVWVTATTYNELRTSVGADGGSADTGSLMVKAGVQVYGGFNSGETQRSERDYVNKVTTIDGATALAGQPAAHVVVVSGTDALIDGFTISGGDARNLGSTQNEYGGGVYLGSKGAIANCIIRDNAALTRGGGVYSESQLAITNCQFIQNETDGAGGGLYTNVNKTTNIPLTDCLFDSNTAALNGGGVYHDSQTDSITSELAFTECTFRGNEATGNGGAIYATNTTPTTALSFTNCSFTDGNADNGGAIHLNFVGAQIDNVDFDNNEAEGGGGAVFAAQSNSLTITNSNFRENMLKATVSSGAAILVSSDTFVVEDCTFENNSTPTADGETGGAIHAFSNTNSTIRRCTFNSNSSGSGGAIRISGPGGTISNSIFYGNSTAESGGAIHITNTTAANIMNCTFDSNSSGNDTGGAINSESSDTTVTNSILRNNGSDWASSGSGTVTITYTNIGDSYAGGGTGNIDTDPFFLDATNGDFRLRQDSPCIDVGTDTGAPADDILGNDRPVDSPGIGNTGANTTDMGAYEMARVVYVDVDTPGTKAVQDGETWATAYDTIQEGIDAAFAAGGAEVWVAEGTYDEARTSPNADDSGEDTGSIVMKSNVHLYGGFGGEETARDQRDWNENITTLDGSTARGGSPAYHVVVGANDATLDGFTVTGGYANGPSQNAQFGGGLACVGTTPTIRRCVFTANAADQGNCAVVVYNSVGAIFDQSTFFENPNGGVVVFDGGATFTNCLFYNNQEKALSISRAFSVSSATIANCTVVDNPGVERGIELSTGSTVTILNTISNGHAVDLYDPDANADVNNSCIVTGAPVGGTGNITTDPIFVDRVNRNYRLGAASPCIDSGTAAGAPSHDIEGTQRPQGLTFDIGAYEFASSQDVDGDGVPDSAEEGLGLDPLVADANLVATIDAPSNGANFRSAPINLSGRLSSPEIDAVVISTDGGNTFPHVATIVSAKSLPNEFHTWSYEWTPDAESDYGIVAKASNIYGGFTTTRTVPMSYRPSFVAAQISSPIHDEHVTGSIDIMGTAAANAIGFDSLVLEYAAGDDPNVAKGVSAWTEITNSASQVNGGIIFSGWDVSALADGPYVLRLTVSDGVLTPLSTHVVIQVDNTSNSIGPVTGLALAGVNVSGVVADGSAAVVTGTAPPGSSVASANIWDVENDLSLKDVAGDITIHADGTVVGNVTMPNGMTTPNVTLRMTVRDAVGNESTVAESAEVLVDNEGPIVEVAFPLANATLPLDIIGINGTATDALADVDTVRWSVNGGVNYIPMNFTDSIFGVAWIPSTEESLTLKVRATDKVGNQTTVDIPITINSAYPSAYITAPETGTEVNEGLLVDIVGTASDLTNFTSYTLRWARGASPQEGYTTFASDTTEVTDALLGQWDTTGLDEGIHTLRLIVVDDTGNIVIFDSLIVVRARLSIVDVPDATLDEDSTIDNHAYLPDFTSALDATEQEIEGYTYSIIGATSAKGVDISADIGATVDGNNNLDIAPAQHWNGTADVTIEVDNGDRTDTDIVKITVNAINDNPSQPVIALTPDPPTTNDNLLCTVATPSTDPDSEAVEYRYQWYRSTNGTQFDLISTVTTSDTSNILSASNTAQGEFWQCIVTPTNANSDGPSAEATVKILSVTTMSNFTVSETSARLGVGIDVTVDVSPSAGRSVTIVYEPSGGKGVGGFFNASNISGDTFGATIYLPDVGNWDVWAEAAQTDDNEQGQTAATTVNIAKARASVLLQAESSGVKPNEPISLSGILGTSPPFPTDQSSILGAMHLNGKTVNVEFEFAGVVEATEQAVTTNNLGQFTVEYTPDPTKIGRWTATATFSGDTALDPADSQPVSVRVQETAGYAILVLGQIGSASGYDDHLLTLQRVYENLKLTQFDDENIAVFNAPAEAFPETVDMQPMNKATLQQYVETWASTRVRENPAPFYFVMVNHGEEDIFHIAHSTNNDDNVITPTDLNTWLDNYTTNLGVDAAGQRALEQPVLIMNGSCHSGSFIDLVSSNSQPPRIVIASADRKEESYKGPPEDGNVRDGELFVSQLFGQLGLGRDLKSAFDFAAGTMSAYTVNATGNGGRSATSYTDGAAQHALLDDNGDGIGTFGLLAVPEVGDEGFVAQTLKLGFGPSTNAVFLEIRDIEPSIQLLSGDGLPTLNMELDAGESGLPWIQIKPPGFAADQTDQSEQKTLEIGDRIFGNANKVLQDWTWTPTELSPHTDFSQIGRYEILYFVANDNGELAPVRQGYVYRAPVDPGAAPSAFSLTFPEDNAKVPSSAIFIWDAATDPEGGEVTYSLILQPQRNATNPTIRIEALREPFYVFPTPTNPPRATDLRDTELYSWSVIAIDPFGNMTTANNAPLNVDIDDATNGVGDIGTAVVTVINDETRDLIPSAVVEVSGGSFNGNMENAGNGQYLLPNVPANTTLAVTVTEADGFTVPQGITLNVSGGNVATGIIELESNQSEDPFDPNGDGSINSSDIQLIINEVLGSNIEIIDADVDGDGQVNSVDIQLIINRVLGI